VTSSLSVLMPVRNGGHFVKRAVISTLRALPSTGELLVMDDGSTDGTPAILSSVNDARLRVFSRRASGGVARALNSLLEESDSPIIARMDADDICLPWRFAVQARLLQRHGGIVFGNAIYCTQRGWPRRPTLRLPRKSSSFSGELLKRNPFVHPTMLMEKEILASVGGYQEVGAEDYDLWLRLAAHDVPFSVAVAPILMYRQHPNQVTSRSQARIDLRSKWFEEETLVTSWAQLADKEYGLTLTNEVINGNSGSIDVLKRRSDFSEAVRRRG
jgi:glycosyltransferase involved in cell wall biosynthesis